MKYVLSLLVALLFCFVSDASYAQLGYSITSTPDPGPDPLPASVLAWITISSSIFFSISLLSIAYAYRQYVQKKKCISKKTIALLIVVFMLGVTSVTATLKPWMNWINCIYAAICFFGFISLFSRSFLYEIRKKNTLRRLAEQLKSFISKIDNGTIIMLIIASIFFIIATTTALVPRYSRYALDYAHQSYSGGMSDNRYMYQIYPDIIISSGIFFSIFLLLALYAVRQHSQNKKRPPKKMFALITAVPLTLSIMAITASLSPISKKMNTTLIETCFFAFITLSLLALIYELRKKRIFKSTVIGLASFVSKME